MSFLTDLFHGNFGNLGTDLVHAPSSLANHPLEIGELAGGAALAAAPFLLPELLGGGAAGGEALGGFLGGGETGLPSDLMSAYPVGVDPSIATNPLVNIPPGPSIGSAVDPSLGTGGFADQPFAQFTPGASGQPVGSSFDITGAVNPQSFNPAVTPWDSSLSPGTFAQAPAGGLDATPIASGTSWAAPTDAALPGISGDMSGMTTGGISPGNLNPSMSNASPSIWDTLKSGAGSFGKQLLTPGALVGAGALGYQMLKGQQPLPDQSKLEGMANQLTPQAQQFMSYLQSGTLPPGMKAAVDQATNAAKAQAISQAAKQGASTDPTLNSQLQQQLAQIDQNALITVAQQGATLFSAGMSEMGLAEQIYTNLMKMDYQQTQDMGKAIANFAASLAGNRGGVNINLGGTHA